MKKDRGTIWLGVANLVINNQGEWLVVKKTYSGLKGYWSLPAGFVKEAETVEMAAKREVLEETGIECNVLGMIGFRSGVIDNKISDNMAIFFSTPIDSTQQAVPEEGEIEEVRWITPAVLSEDPLASSMLREMAKYNVQNFLHNKITDFNPGAQFGYTAYELYFKKQQ